MPPDDTDRLDDADLPGLEDDSPSPESDALPETAETHDRESDVEAEATVTEEPQGADEGISENLPPDMDMQPDWLWPMSGSEETIMDLTPAPPFVSDSVVGELAPYPAMETLVDARHKLLSPKRALPRWIFVGGGFGILGLVLAVGFLLGGGDTDDVGVAIPSESPVEDTSPSSTASVVEDTAAPATAVDVPDVEAPFPTLWNYTATKTASIVPAPDFITATPIGTELSWAFDVTETCEGEACTYVTVIDLMFPGGLVGEIPDATWVVDGTEWSLDVTWHSGQSTYSDGTSCVIRNHEIFTLTVTEETIGGRSVPVTFEGTWEQAAELDLGASTGDLSLCGQAWEYADQWTVAGVAS